MARSASTFTTITMAIPWEWERNSGTTSSGSGGESWRTCWYGTSIANHLVKGHINYPLAQEPHEDDEYEVTYGLHGDVEYVYVINCRARTIRCYSIPWDDEFHKDFRIQWGKVFTRRCLEHIPTIPEREAYIKDYEARQAARRAAAIR